MAGEEIFIANSLLILPLILTFLTIYILNSNKQSLIADAALIGCFICLLLGIRVMDRAFQVIDPIGQMYLITSGFLDVFMWIIMLLVVMLFIKLLINIINIFRQGKWDTYDNKNL